MKEKEYKNNDLEKKTAELVAGFIIRDKVDKEFSLFKKPEQIGERLLLSIEELSSPESETVINELLATYCLSLRSAQSVGALPKLNRRMAKELKNNRLGVQEIISIDKDLLKSELLLQLKNRQK